MQKTKTVFLLCLFLSITTFFSCGEIVDPANREILDIKNIQFLKAARYHIIDEIGLPWLELAHLVDEYTIGDTVFIRCSVQLPDWPSYDKTIVARVSSSKAHDVKHIAFLQEAGFSYIMPVPPPPLIFVGHLYLSSVDSKDEVLRVSPDGDVLTVEIKYNKQVITKTIPVNGR